MQGVFKDHDVAFLCGFGLTAQIAVFKYSGGALIPPDVKQIYLTNNTWDIGKNYYGESAIFGDIKATLPLINDHIRKNPPADAAQRNDTLKGLDAERRREWDEYLAEAMAQQEIWAVVIAEALRKEILGRGLEKQFVYVHEAVSDGAPFQYLLPLGTKGAEPISYYCVAGGSLGWSMPASLGIKLENTGWQGIETRLVVNAVGDGSSLFYPQTWWTAAHRRLGILYIITNNHEYHTLQLGLQQVIGAYGSAPGYEWNPKTDDPDYLRIRRPKPDFVALAGALGGQPGEVVRGPENVADAVRRGIDHVMTTRQSYILDMRTALETPAAPVTDEATSDETTATSNEATHEATHEATIEQMVARYVSQPPLDIFHRPMLKGVSNNDASNGAAPGTTNLPLIF